MNVLKQVRKPTLDLPIEARRKMWRAPFLRSYLVVYFAYVCMYLIRKNFNVSQNDLLEQYHFTKADLGQIGFYFSITYGVGKSVVSYFGDGTNTKNYVSALLILSALTMFGFGLLTGSLAGMILFYALNGFFQSAGGPSSYSTVTKWTSQKNRGTFLGIWNTSHNLGGALAAIVATAGAEYFFNGDVKGMFLFPASIAFIFGILGLFIGSDSPEAYGLGKAEELFDEKPSEEDLKLSERVMSKWNVFTHFVLKNPYVWALCFANVFVYTIRIGVDQWGIVYSKEVLGLSKEVAKSGFTLFETGALIGTLLWGFGSDLMKGRRALVSILALILVFFALGFYQNAKTEETYKTSMFILGFLIFGPQLLIGVSGVGFVPKNAISVSDGIKGTFGYLLGDSFAKLGMGMMADNKSVLGLSGWNGTFTAMYASAIIAILIMAYVAYGEENKIKQARGHHK